MGSNGSKHENATYSAAQARSALQGSLDGVDVPWVREYAGYVNNRETLDHLNQMCALYEEHGENYLETREAQIILRSAATRTTDRAFEEGNVSQLQGAVGLRDRSRDAVDGFDIAVQRIADEGSITFVVGPPGSGKTAMMADLLRAAAARTGAGLVTNMRWSANDEQIRTDREMFEAMAQTPRQVIAGLDELSRELTGRGSSAKQAEEFGQLLTLVRKRESKHGPHPKRGSVVGVAHTKKRLAAVLRRLATTIIQKPSRSDPGRFIVYRSEGGSDELEEIGEFQGLTDTREDLDEHEASSFTVVGDEDPDEEDDREDPKEVAKRKDVETAIRAILQGASQSDAADLTDWGRGWVGERWREWKDGAHRDLVERPETLPETVADQAEEIA